MSPTHRFRTHLPYPPAQVWDWFGRPGAFLRLAPPWQTLQPYAEAANLRDGRAELRAQVAGRTIPGSTWVAQHDPGRYLQGQQFADRCVSEPMATITGWDHLHRFEADAEGTTVIDEVTTRLPRRMLEPIFAYRRTQLLGDLAAHAKLGPVAPLTVAITGVSGLIGSALAAYLSTGGHRVISLARKPTDPARRSYEERNWDPDSPARDLLEGVDALVHLAGASIAGRFTDEHMATVRDSRVGPTRALAELAASGPHRPKVFVSASAIGYYGADHEDELLTEDSPAGEDFVASVVREWEDAALSVDNPVRTVLVRTGIVQSARGGTLGLLRRLFETGLGGRLGDGRQWMSWIALDDLLDVYLRAITDESLQGPVNGVSAEPVRNSEFTRALGSALHRPTLLPVPSFGPKLVLGSRGADELALASQRVSPSVLLQSGHTFRWPTIERALAHEVGRDR
ncbi:TIGR01777 family protein [Calidifontibacter sp. DB0510]|uniref:TIGR01777 family protein n=1 Tax=Metallococcus carri TaxID=1656884 RepID=A0A967EG21_9MICO|nr:TIGR01777 family oxidoreductase [Metallococcus carri]NHN57151.1 TIGR01777 family protein [Metallococcus carri]NOP38046.1 TIGR01777 family protein [Calidifontibacter sp. DB2511S]